MTQGIIIAMLFCIIFIIGTCLKVVAETIEGFNFNPRQYYSQLVVVVAIGGLVGWLLS